MTNLSVSPALHFFARVKKNKLKNKLNSLYPISLIKTDINDLAALFKTNKRHEQFKSHKVQIEV
jgi:hypothetical protein